jgi:hypothetical protein
VAETDWSPVYRTARDAIITIAALFFMFVEIQHDARLPVLMFLASLLGIPTGVRSWTALRNAANGQNHGK